MSIIDKGISSILSQASLSEEDSAFMLKYMKDFISNGLDQNEEQDHEFFRKIKDNDILYTKFKRLVGIARKYDPSI